MMTSTSNTPIFTVVGAPGTGTTAITALLAQAYAQRGRHVLAVNLDRQNNLTEAMSADPALDRLAADERIVHTEMGVDVMPNAAAAGAVKGGCTFRDVLRRQTVYDLILVDGGTREFFHDQWAVQAADRLLLVVSGRTEGQELTSLRFLGQKLEELRQDSQTCQEAGVILNFCEPDSTPGRNAVYTLGRDEALSQLPLLGTVPEDNLIRRALESGKSFFQLAPESPAAQAVQTIRKQL